MADDKLTGSFRLFRLLGIGVHLHWLWFGLLLIQVAFVRKYYVDASPHHIEARLWQFAELVGGFAIVLMHEFGHATACRSVGGDADEIVLWPLGGIAFVEPPDRPGAVLWSLAAGPLVNVVLAPILFLTFAMCTNWHGEAIVSINAALFLKSIAWINLGLLCFNLLPIYPLDGGQIVQALLWFKLGRGPALRVAACISMALGVGLGLAAWHWHQTWIFVMAAFICYQSWNGLGVAKEMDEEEREDREEAAAQAAALNPSRKASDSSETAPASSAATDQQ